MLFYLFFFFHFPGLTMAMYDLKNSYPKLIVAASHAALSGDLAVLVLDLPPSESAQKIPEETITDSDDSMDEEEMEDIEQRDALQAKNDNLSRGPFVLRYIY